MNVVEVLLKSRSDRWFLSDARWVPDGRKKPLVIFIHGFKGFKDWGHFNLVADIFAQNGFVFSKLNLSHNGTTPAFPAEFTDLEAFGDNTFSKELDDIGTLMDAFTMTELVPNAEIDTERIYLIGHSRGGGLAFLKAGEDARVKKVASWAAIHDLSRRWPQDFLNKWKKEGIRYVLNGRTGQNMPVKYDLVLDFLNNRDRLDIPSKVGQLQIPLLICHGTKDSTLDVSMAKELKSWSADGELFILEGADHVFGAKHPYNSDILPGDSQKVVNRTIEFFHNR